MSHTLIKRGNVNQNDLFGMISVPVAWNLTFMMTAPMMKYATRATSNLNMGCSDTGEEMTQ